MRERTGGGGGLIEEESVGEIEDDDGMWETEMESR